MRNCEQNWGLGDWERVMYQGRSKGTKSVNFVRWACEEIEEGLMSIYSQTGGNGLDE